MNNNCSGCGKPVLKGKALAEAKKMEKKQGVSRNWRHRKCEDK